MIRGKTFLCLLFVVLLIQIQVPNGSATSQSDLRALLRKALQVDFCSRVIPVTRPIPLRFRRSPQRVQFQCTITLD